jgi:hypothetical protein
MFATACLILLASCAPPPGQMLLDMEVRVDGAHVLTTSFSVSDSAPLKDIWARTGRPPFGADDAASKVTPSPDDPLQATLSGTVGLRIIHVDRLIASAAVTNLELKRDNAANHNWYLSEGELQRVLDAADIK